MDGELKPDWLQTPMSGFGVKFSGKVLLSASYRYIEA
jgi:hypothetical protein